MEAENPVANLSAMEVEAISRSQSRRGVTSGIEMNREVSQISRALGLIDHRLSSEDDSSVAVSTVPQRLLRRQQILDSLLSMSDAERRALINSETRLANQRVIGDIRRSREFDRDRYTRELDRVRNPGINISGVSEIGDLVLRSFNDGLAESINYLPDRGSQRDDTVEIEDLVGQISDSVPQQQFREIIQQQWESAPLDDNQATASFGEAERQSNMDAQRDAILENLNYIGQASRSGVGVDVQNQVILPLQDQVRAELGQSMIQQYIDQGDAEALRLQRVMEQIVERDRQQDLRVAEEQRIAWENQQRLTDLAPRTDQSNGQMAIERELTRAPRVDIANSVLIQDQQPLRGPVPIQTRLQFQPILVQGNNKGRDFGPGTNAIGSDASDVNSSAQSIVLDRYENQRRKPTFMDSIQHERMYSVPRAGAKFGDVERLKSWQLDPNKLETYKDNYTRQYEKLGLGKRQYQLRDGEFDLDSLQDESKKYLKLLKAATAVRNDAGERIYRQPTLGAAKALYKMSMDDNNKGIDGLRATFGTAGTLTGQAALDFANAAADPQDNPQLLAQAIGGTGTLAILSKEPTSHFNKNVNDQYAQVIEAIEKQLGERTNKNYWDGRAESTKLLWDLWIQVLKDEQKDLMGDSLTVANREVSQGEFTGVGDLDLQDPRLQINQMDTLLEIDSMSAAKIQVYFPKDVDFAVPIHFGYIFRQAGGGRIDFDALLRDYGNTGKRIVKMGNDKFMIIIRSWNKKLNQLKVSFTSKFGPFDVIYKLAGSYQRKYWKGASAFPPDILSAKIYEDLMEQRGELPEENFFRKFHITKAAFLGTAAGIDFVKKAKIVVNTWKQHKLFPNDRVPLQKFFANKFTLARWFWGKKAALEKISKDRIKQYLDKDKQDLRHVYNFLGTDLNLKTNQLIKLQKKMDLENSAFDRSGQQIIGDRNQAEIDWATFCAMPDKVTPVKMPSLFPIPTHIVRRRMTKTVDAYYWDKLMWSPEYVYGQGVLIGKPGTAANIPSYTPAANSVYDHALATVAQSGIGSSSYVCQKDTGSWAQFTGNQGYMQYYFDTTPPLQDAVSAGGQRLIGALIEIEYLGKTDDIQGIVEIAMNINTVNTKHTYCPLEDINFLGEDAIQQSPYYKRFRLSDGVRAIWFPMDETRFDFNECFQTVDRNDAILGGLTQAGSTTYFDQNQTRCWIFPTKNIGSLHATQGNYFLPPGAHQYPSGPLDTKTPYRQDNDSLHDKTRIEWAINFTGLTQSCPVRIYINQYYETVPHESEMDNFFPTKGPSGNTDVATKLIQKVAGDISPSPSNAAYATSMNVMSKMWDIANRMGIGIARIPGIPETAGVLVGGRYGGLFGLGPGYRAGKAVRQKYDDVSAKLMPYKSKNNQVFANP